MRQSDDPQSKNLISPFIYEVTVDALTTSLADDAFFTSMDDYVPERNILINSSRRRSNSASGSNFITDFHSPASNEIPSEWRKYLRIPFCFHVHDYCQITKVKTGKILYIVNNMQIEMQKGDIIIINANSIHSWLAVEFTTNIGIGFYPAKFSLNEYCMHYDNSFNLFYSMQFPYVFIPRNLPVYKAVNRCLENILSEHNNLQADSTIMIHNYLIELSLHCIRTFMKPPDSTSIPPQQSATLRQAMRYIAENLDTLTGVQEIAEHVHLNPSYFSNYFRKKVGISCTKYISLQRLSRAAELLQTTDISLSDIAYKCGFQSISNFYHLFGTLYTISPAKFRKLHQ